MEKIGGLEVTEARWLRSLEKKNAELKKMAVELSLAEQMLKDLRPK